MKFRFALTAAWIMVSMIILTTASHYYIEKKARECARQSLEQVRTCTANSKEDGIIDKLAICAKGVRTTTTGDIFAYNTVTRQFVFDASTDCHTEATMRMTAESICSVHADPSACVEAMHRMDMGVDSSKEHHAQWLFDDSPELLEWVVYPDNSGGVRWLNTGDSVKEEQIVIALGVQLDELNQSFAVFYLLIIGLAFIGLVFSLLLGIFDKRVFSYGVDRRNTKEL